MVVQEMNGGNVTYLAGKLYMVVVRYTESRIRQYKFKH